jgi:hypothetical protein
MAESNFRLSKKGAVNHYMTELCSIFLNHGEQKIETKVKTLTQKLKNHKFMDPDVKKIDETLIR